MTLCLSNLPCFIVTTQLWIDLLQGLGTMALASTCENVSSKKYAGGRHESLNETNRDEVTADIIDWLKGI